MNRRTFLAAGAGVGASTLAGCGSLGGGSTPTESTNSYPPDSDEDDGYPPEFEGTPTEVPLDPGSFDTVRRNGVDVPLAPVNVAYYWYLRREARFADARSSVQYDRSHIYGAVWSPYNGRSDDPVLDWPGGDRIVCYCGCPHHLSSIRASKLIQEGYEEVYVIDEGFWEWTGRGYPVVGTAANAKPPTYVVEGVVDDAHAGATAWARHDPTGQVEATAIGPNGRYALELAFADVTTRSVVTVETPDYRIEAPLEELTTGLVTGA